MGGGSGFALYVEKAGSATRTLRSFPKPARHFVLRSHGQDLLHGRSDPSTTFNSEVPDAGVWDSRDTETMWGMQVLSCETSFIIGDLELAPSE